MLTRCPHRATDITSTVSSIVTPAGSASRRDAQVVAESVELLQSELMFTRTPLAMASYPALAFRVRQADPELLKSSLAAALERHRSAAGRLYATTIVLNDQGVPFTLCESSRLSAPEQVPENELLHLADWRRPVQVVAGMEPLLTVKLTRFRDGSAILVMCRSHGLMDGSSAWAFLGDWARAARGEAMVAGRVQALNDDVPNEDELHRMWIERFGEPIGSMEKLKAWMAQCLMPIVTPVMDAYFLSGLSGDLDRPHLFFSDAQLAAIKAAATPAVPGAWVTTQEAFSAYILLIVGRTLLPETSAGRVAATFLLDARKAIGRKPTETFGSGITFLTAEFEGLLQMPLADVAGKLHEAATDALSQKEIGTMWRLGAGCQKAGYSMALFGKTMPRSSQFDICLWLNNQSKRELPDFGEACSGGQAQSVVTNAGPTLMLPAAGGISLYLDPSTLRAARTPADRAAAIEALKTSVPKCVSGSGSGSVAAAPAGGASADAATTSALSIQFRH